MMNTKTMRKAARDLVPGDVVVYPDDVRLVVFAIDQSDPNSGPPPFTRIHWATLRDYRPTKPLFCSPDSQFTAEIPVGLTPVQAAADKLLHYARAYLECISNPRVPTVSRDEAEALCVLLDELEPPKPPTLEEALNVLRCLTQNVRTAGPCATPDALVADAERLLKRVPD